MEKIISFCLLLFAFSFLFAQEIFYEHYGNEVEIWVVLPYNSISFLR